MATVYERSWAFDISRAVADSSSVANLSKSLLWGLVQFLTGRVGGATQGLWTITQSCDGTQVASSDLWGSTFDASKIVRAAAGQAHSWMVLKSPDALGPVYMTLDVSGSSDSAALNLKYSYTAPTSGTTTACPTASDNWNHAANLQLNDNTANPMKLHMGLTSLGEFYALGSKNGSTIANLGLLCLKLLETNPADLYPVFTYAQWNSSTASPFDLSNFVAPTPWRGRSHNNAAALTAINLAYPYNGSTYFLGSSFIAAGGDKTNQQYPDFPIYLGATDSNYQSVRGRLPDLRWGPGAAVLTDGTVEPITGDVKSMIHGDVWFPSNAAPSM